LPLKKAAVNRHFQGSIRVKGNDLARKDPSMTALTFAVQQIRRLAEVDMLRRATDRQLLDRFVHSRDEEAFTELVRRHGPLVLGVCRRVLRHAQDAEDAFQATFLVLARKAGSVRGGASVGGWLYQVAYRQALRARAVTNRRRQVALRTDLPEMPAPDPGPLHSSLDDELHHLPECYRSAVVLCYLEGRTQAEAARLLATTADAVNSRLKRARELLRRRLNRGVLAVFGLALAPAAAPASLPPPLARLTARAALRLVTRRAAAVTLVKGALHGMIPSRCKALCGLVLLLALAAAGTALVAPPTSGDGPGEITARPRDPAQPAPRAAGKPAARTCILLWMSGGPSQLDTFDLKPGNGDFRPINTAAKGVQISQHLPRLAKLADHLAIIRSLTHKEGDHARAAHLMRTGHPPDGQTSYADLPSALAWQLGKGQPGLPGYVSIGPLPRAYRSSGFGPGSLGPRFAPVVVAEVRRFDGSELASDELLRLPPAEAFDLTATRRAQMLRKAVAGAFDLGAEKPAVRAA
jgi:RNA polymerase sigma factor (sigma-70 family)